VHSIAFGNHLKADRCFAQGAHTFWEVLGFFFYFQVLETYFYAYDSLVLDVAHCVSKNISIKIW